MSKPKFFANYPVVETISLSSSGIFIDSSDLYGLHALDEHRGHLLRVSHLDGQLTCLSPAAPHKGRQRKAIARDVYERNLLPPAQTFWISPNRLWLNRLKRKKAAQTLLEHFDVLLIKGGSDLMPLDKSKTAAHKQQGMTVAPSEVHDGVEIALLDALVKMPPDKAPFGLLICRGLEEEFRRILGTEPEPMHQSHWPEDEGPYMANHGVQVIESKPGRSLGVSHVDTINSYHGFGYHYTTARAKILERAGWHVLMTSKIEGERQPVIECAAKLTNTKTGEPLVSAIAFQGHPERDHTKDGELLRLWTQKCILNFIAQRQELVSDARPTQP